MDVAAAARRWAETWQHTWPAKEAAHIAALYADTASYRSSPFGEPEPGGALPYVERQFAVEEAVECRFAEPIASASALRSSGLPVLSRPIRPSRWRVRRCCASMLRDWLLIMWTTGCSGR